MNKEKFLKFYENTANYNNAKITYEAVEKALLDLPCPTCGSHASTVNPLIIAGILATIRVEVGKVFLPIRENMNYSADSLLKVFPKYFNMALAKQYEYQPERIANKVYANRMGNGDEGSGDGWRYRGAGFIQFTGKSNWEHYGLNEQNCLDITTNAKATVKYFEERGIFQACLSKNWIEVRRLVNGGTNGLNDFLSVITQYVK